MKRDTAADMLAFALLLFGALCMIGPFIWMIATSLKPVAEQYDGRLIPITPTSENYPRLFEIIPMHLLLWNSFKIAAIATFGQLLTCSMAGFIFAVVRFPFRNVIFVILLVTLMVPGQVTAIPQFVIFKFLGLYGTQAPLYLPAFLGGAFGTFLMRQYFLTIPIELAEAARIDGASLARIFFTIYLPLAKPALAAFAIFAFMFSWNDLFNALIYLPSNLEKTTLTVGLALFQTQYSGQWPLMMAASLISVAPIIIVFFLAQRHFISGISMSGLK
ncbi:carbohydrate ABC transporter membrane protein 2 (CUT1 family) [Yoonia maricola]|uniref:Carbohydrate ABC transporter membrane protein 2 (CUT1 family) n=1 Tax=Yoonia maricola TaxID=420999 RepID=A0A2M8WLQ9_9RHOB|nr:carbohydrate ABC transporter permease [Yoonia maricola]PJI91862.1 carbohydrate ABC transporter membrane protein 2 (CUT1 family) [Yoonia maricola]